MRIRHAIAVAAVAAIAPVTLAAPADAATCEIHNGAETKLAYNVISGYGSIGSGCASPWTVTVEIQRSRWNGWETMKSERITRAGYDQYVFYDCTGTGIHDFRARVFAWRHGPYRELVKYSPRINEVVCD